MGIRDIKEGKGFKLFGVVDIGSNTIKTTVYHIDDSNFSIIFKDKYQSSFAKGLMYSGLIDEKSIELSLKYLRDLKHTLDAFTEIDFKVVASSALRIADNSDDFKVPAEEILEEKIEVISEDREAELAVAGISLELDRINGLVLDLGGGSLELANVKSDKILHTDSCLLGHQIMADYAENGMDELHKHINKTLKSLALIQETKFKNLYLSGGRFRRLAKLHMKLSQGKIQDFRAYKLSFEEVQKLIKHGEKDIKHSKRESLLMYFASILLNHILQYVPANNIYFCRHSIREGLLKEYLV